MKFLESKDKGSNTEIKVVAKPKFKLIDMEKPLDDARLKGIPANEVYNFSGDNYRIFKVGSSCIAQII